MTIDKKLLTLNACTDAREWADGKSFEEIWNTCHRGDWLLWLLFKADLVDVDIRYRIKLAILELHWSIVPTKYMAAIETIKSYLSGECDIRVVGDAYGYALDIYYSDRDSRVPGRVADMTRAVIHTLDARSYAVIDNIADAVADDAADFIPDSNVQLRHQFIFRARRDTYARCADVIRNMVPFESIKSKI